MSKVDNTHYQMPDATAPKGAQYIGVFIWDGATDKRGPRAGADVKWTTSDSAIVKLGETTDSGQAIISILKAGTATLTASLGDMTSYLTITAVAATPEQLAEDETA